MTQLLSLLAEREFGYLGDTIFLNSCSVSLPPMRVRQFCTTFMEDYAKSTGATLSQFDLYRADAKKQIAALINAPVDEIAFTKNTTEGNSILAGGLELSSGDNVILADIEHPALLYPWLQQQKRGVQVRIVTAQDGVLPVQAYLRQMDANTKVVALSAVQYGSGYLADLRELCRQCHARGILVAVDAIQALGRIPINVKGLGIDYLSCGSFKGLMGALGSGFLYCRRDLIPRIRPPYTCYHSVPAHQEFPAVPTDFLPPVQYEDTRRFDAGSSNTYGAVSMGLGASLINEIGVDTIYAHICHLERQLRQQLTNPKLHLLGGSAPNHLSGTLAWTFDPAETDRLQAMLQAERIKLTLRDGYMRLQLHFYNTAEQMDKVAAVLHSF